MCGLQQCASRLIQAISNLFARIVVVLYFIYAEVHGLHTVSNVFFRIDVHLYKRRAPSVERQYTLLQVKLVKLGFCKC